MLQDLLSKFSSPAEKQGYLQQLTAAYPYFAPAQFCLLQTLRPDEAAYGHRAAITHLLYNNAFWLQYQLAQTADVLPAVAPSISTEGMIAPEINEAVDGIEGPNGQDLGGEMAHIEAEINEPNAGETTLAAETVHIETGNLEPAPVETEAVLPTVDTVLVEGTPETTVSDLPQPMEMPMETAPAMPLPAPEKEEMLFEPLFAVDYFASQGIKLTDDVQPGDKLGNQLKSFTEWLKSMKKTRSKDVQANDEGPDETVVAIAEKSNAEDDVVTEAMAEVFALQGRKQKAVAIYRKLSLLNPHKSAYFAAKIENLK